MNDLLQWPWKRFERFYEAAQKRTIIETLERRKDGMIAALWSNSNYDGDGKSESPRQKAIEDIESRYDGAVSMILTGKAPEDEEEEFDESNPFIIAMRRGQAKLMEARNDEGTVAQVVAEQ